MDSTGWLSIATKDTKHIFSTLHSYGRLTAVNLAQKCRLSLQQTYNGLVVLSQLGLLFYFDVDASRSIYQVNLKNAYLIVRSGKFIEAVPEECGQVATSMVTHLLFRGHADVPSLEEIGYGASKLINPSNTSTKAAAISAKSGLFAPRSNGCESKAVLRLLCEHGLLYRLRKSHHHVNADNRQVAEDRIVNGAMHTVARGTRSNEELAARVTNEVQKQVDGRLRPLRSHVENEATQQHWIDGMNDHIHGLKRQRLPNGISATTEASEHKHDSTTSSRYPGKDLVVKFNPLVFTVSMWAQRLVTSVEKVHGSQISRTYSALLRQARPQLQELMMSTVFSSEICHVPRISMEFDERCLARDCVMEAGTRETLDEAVVNGFSDHTEQALISKIRNHLNILSQAPHRFLDQTIDNCSKLHIDSPRLTIHLQNIEIFRLAAARFDKYAVRILRVLFDKGRVDEKYLQELVLMSAKELRQRLASLHRAGFIDLQEVPREAQRQPSRTIYLWFYDLERVKQTVIEDTYKTMSRCLQRLKFEKAKVRQLIERGQKTNTNNQKSSLLSKAELQTLAAWQWKEKWILAEVARLDDLILVLRDF